MTAIHTGELVDRIGEAVLADPAVARLDGGPFQTVATYLPGRRVVGVTAADRITVSVVLRFDQPIPAVVAALRDRVRRVAGDLPIDVHVNDLESKEVPA
ncbi:hypothetical protein SAMN05192558_110325 [Actinokineospora alba]|uniref:Asp23 family, cell envelope-related function n=1 Tax=Actinokineospora alba TaxID=504798 RepID=A0A1H0U157_9PSEU|nr:hypothetical protein [Actinokineospora alba]TDP70843.1 hypothetical protein C8E96_6473 [Actinokineospora alba]SDJ17831.1 hypothetical protein SAMN05421871_110325 [Actinokineospora alba]SDP59909.1 hypothetical protein SAMN05192558_110325 [Actinokineospora alba]